MTIICGTDLSKRSEPAMHAAAALARRLDEPLWLMHVLEDAATLLGPGSHDALLADTTARLDLELASLAGTVPAGVQRAVRTGKAHEELLSAARAEGATLIVVSSRGHGESPLYRVGGTSERIALESSLPVLVVRDAAPFEAWSRGDRPLRVVVGVDFSASAASALRWVKALRVAGPCDVVAAHVYDTVDAFRRYGRRRVQSLFQSDPEIESLLRRDVGAVVSDVTGTEDIPIRLYLAIGRVSDHLLEVAAEERADLLVVGTHHRRGPGRLWSVSSGVLHHAPMSVTVVPMPAAPADVEELPTLRRILVATDLSPESIGALPYAYALLGRHGGEVHLLHVVDATEDIPAVEAQASTRLRALIPAAAAQEGIVTRVEVARGPPARTICECAERLGVDVVCLASRGGPAIARALLGSTVQAVLAQTRKPVLVVRPPSD